MPSSGYAPDDESLSEEETKPRDASSRPDAVPSSDAADTTVADDDPPSDSAPPPDTAAPADTKPAMPTPSPECVAYCGCVVPTCAKYAGYPFASDKACLDRCATMTNTQLKCWTFFCSNAKKAATSSAREHDCRHAWGGLGLEECP